MGFLQRTRVQDHMVVIHCPVGGGAGVCGNGAGGGASCKPGEGSTGGDVGGGVFCGRRRRTG